MTCEFTACQGCISRNQDTRDASWATRGERDAAFWPVGAHTDHRGNMVSPEAAKKPGPNHWIASFPGWERILQEWILVTHSFGLLWFDNRGLTFITQRLTNSTYNWAQVLAWETSRVSFLLEVKTIRLSEGKISYKYCGKYLMVMPTISWLRKVVPKLSWMYCKWHKHKHIYIHIKQMYCLKY